MLIYNFNFNEKSDPNFFSLKMFLLSYSNNMPGLKKFYLNIWKFPKTSLINISRNKQVIDKVR
jgi:hypothetical protein